MKKVLLVVLGVLGLGGIALGFMIYKKTQESKLIKQLDKFKIPEQFDAYTEVKALKDSKEPAPLHEVKVQGEPVVPRLAGIVRDASKPENVRCASIIILAHIALNAVEKKDEIVNAIIDALQEKEGRVGECASILTSKLDSDKVPVKIAEVLKSATDAKVRMNSFRAITLWVTDDSKRKRNQVVMEEVLKGVDEKDKTILMLVLRNSKRVQFKFDAKEGKKSLGEQLEDKVLPMIALDDEELAKAASVALGFQHSYMSDEQKGEGIKRVAAYAAGDRKKHVRLNALLLLKNLNGELAQNTATIANCDLDAVMSYLESDDPDFLKPALETLKQCGTLQKHRAAVKAFKERERPGTTEELRKLAGEAIEKILKREEGGE